MYWAIPRYVPSESIQKLLQHVPEAINIPSLEILPDTTEQHFSVPKDTLIPVMRLLKHAATRVEEEYRKHLDTIESAYEILASDKLRTMTLEEIANELKLPMEYTDPKNQGKRSNYLMYALHRALTRADNDVIQMDRYKHRVFNRFEILPRNTAARRKRVFTWIRKYQELVSTLSVASRVNDVGSIRDALKESPVTKFANKARGIVTRSRASREEKDGFFGPYKGPIGDIVTWSLRSPEDQELITQETFVKRISTDAFSSSDRDIIETLLDWCVYYELIKDGPMDALGTFLLRATGLYENAEIELTGRTAFLFLREIGVISPWHIKLRQHEAGFPLLNRVLTPSLTRDDHQNRFTKVEGLVDTMADLRENMNEASGTVYCIDSYSTKTIDDGVSLERIPGESAVWIHAYIADPCAYFLPSHPLAKRARNQAATMYLPNAVSTMLPNDLVERQLGLDRGRAALRFSAKLDESGRVLESKVTPVTLGDKFVKIDPERAHKLLGIQKVVSEGYPVVVGPQPVYESESTETSPLTSSQIEELETLQRFSEAYFQQRLNRGLAAVYDQQMALRLWNGDSLHLGRDLTSLDTAQVYMGDPSIYHQSAESNPEDGMPRFLFVNPFMSMACEMAAEWTASRNIVSAYRGNLAGSTAESRSIYYREVVRPLWDSLGFFPTEFSAQHQKICGESGLSPDPVPWDRLGAKRYSKSTSPLRRYEDMIVHWQIEGALRREATTGRRFDGNNPEDVKALPWSRSELEQALVETIAKQHLIARASRKCEGHWQLQAVGRAFNFNECKLPETYEFVVYTPVVHIHKPVVVGKIASINMTAYMSVEDGRGIHMGDRFECRITKVLADQGIRVEMIRSLGKAKHRQHASQQDVDLITRAYSVTPEVQKAVQNLVQVYSAH